MVTEGIAPDSSFFICFSNDLNRHELIHDTATMYSIYIGKRVLNETSQIFEDETLRSMVAEIDVDYYEIVKPYFGRSEKHEEDGEYEAIGIAFFLYQKNDLRFLILDERRATKFTNRYFPELSESLVGTVGFIRDCCIVDRKISQDRAIEIFTAMKEAIEGGVKEMPCGMDKTTYKKILISTMKEIEGG